MTLFWRVTATVSTIDGESEQTRYFLRREKAVAKGRSMLHRCLYDFGVLETRINEQVEKYLTEIASSTEDKIFETFYAVGIKIAINRITFDDEHDDDNGLLFKDIYQWASERQLPVLEVPKTLKGSGSGRK